MFVRWGLVVPFEKYRNILVDLELTILGTSHLICLSIELGPRKK
jgi:hypothetical protein